MIEAVITIAIIGTFFAAVTIVFTVLGKGVMSTRTRTVATNLAQEKIESLKNITYSRLRVTSQADYTAQGHDVTYYPPETGILVGDIPYQRTVLIRRASEGAGGQLVDLLPDDGDTSLKKITVTVSWSQDGKPRSFSLSNVREDPNRRPMDGTITGTITDDASGMVLPETSVAIVDDLNWNAVTNAAGSYSIKVPTGTYQLKIEKDGYWPKISGSITVPAGAPTVSNQTLRKKAVGAVEGYVYYNDKLVVAQVCASTVSAFGEDIEWIELYNPTTFSWQLDSYFYLGHYDQFGNLRYIHYPAWSSSYLPYSVQTTSTIAPHSYYLFASTPVVVLGDVAASSYTVIADAVVTDPDGDLIEANKRGALIIWSWYNGNWKSDLVGWAPSAETAPSYEGFPIKDGNGLDPGKAHVRCSLPGSFSPDQGGAFDSDYNNVDFLKNVTLSTAAPQFFPRNSLSTAVPKAGHCAWNAVITCDDGVSSPSTANMLSTDTYRRAYFMLPAVATGTWNVAAYYSDWTGYRAFREVTNVQVPVNGSLTAITNASTSPSWPQTGYNHIILTGTTDKGIVRGYVQNGGWGVAGIKVEAGASSAYSGLAGSYSLSLESGTYALTANPNNLNASYTSKTVENIAVTPGIITSNVNFDIAPGGAIGGRVISNAGDPLADTLVVAYDLNGNEARSSLTGPDGRFTVKNLSTGGNTYTVRPAFDAGETSSPASRNVNVTAGGTQWNDTAGYFSSFTVVSAYGNITGTVTNGGRKINTGILIIATTSTITADPPDFDYTLRSSGAFYYGTVSHSDGTYALPVRGGYAYNVYAWYTVPTGDSTVSSSKKDASSGTVNASATATVNFAWP